MKIDVFWDVVPCSLVDIYKRFREAYCLHHPHSEAENSYETRVSIYQTTQSYIPENSHFMFYCQNITVIINIPKVAVEWLKPLLHIQEVPGSNLGPEAGYAD
jgi:hypothetical protein